MILGIVFGIIGIVIGCLIVYFLLSPKIKNVEEINESVRKQNQEEQEKFQKLQQAVFEVEREYCDTKTKTANEQVRLTDLNQQNEKMVSLLSQQREAAKTAANDYKKECLNAAEAELQLEKQKWEKEKELYKNLYFEMMKDSAQSYVEEMDEKRKELNELTSQVQDLKAAVQASIAAAKRAAADKDNKDFYRTQISDDDLLEIKRLREIIPFFRNSRPICKIIWESYYRTPTNDLINRLEIKDKEIGIYKITNTLNKKVYIGQSVDLSSRWKEHIKCGLGIDAPNNNLYKAMQKDGVENFVFEKLENCSREELNKKEKYWIDFYKSQDFGYNMTTGGSQYKGS